MTWTVPPEWVGETAFLLGCGPSLAQAHTSQLRDAGRVIAINDAYLKAPWADVLYFTDRKWYQQHAEQVAAAFWGRHIVTLDNRLDGVKTLRSTGQTGLETDPACLRHGSNSGYAAIGLAYHFGATRIVLIGYDMQLQGGQTHWRHREKDAGEAFQRTLTNVMLPNFSSLVTPLAEAGVEVINCTPGSALKVWPIESLDVVLERLTVAEARPAYD